MLSIKTAIPVVTSASLLLAGVSQAHVSQADASQAIASQEADSNTNYFSLVKITPLGGFSHNGVYFKTTNEYGELADGNLCNVGKRYPILRSVYKAEMSGVHFTGDWEDPTQVEVNWGEGANGALGHWTYRKGFFDVSKDKIWDLDDQVRGSCHRPAQKIAENCTWDYTTDHVEVLLECESPYFSPPSGSAMKTAAAKDLNARLDVDEGNINILTDGLGDDINNPEITEYPSLVTEYPSLVTAFPHRTPNGLVDDIKVGEIDIDKIDVGDININKKPEPQHRPKVTPPPVPAPVPAPSGINDAHVYVYSKGSKLDGVMIKKTA